MKEQEDHQKIERDAMYLENLAELEKIFHPSLFSESLLPGSWYVSPHDRFNSRSDLRSFFFIDQDASMPKARGVFKFLDNDIAY